MKKNIIAILSFVFYALPLHVHAATDVGFQFHEPTVSELVAISIDWVMLALIPLLFLLAVIIITRNFFRKDTKNKKKVATKRDNRAPMKLVVPLIIFLGSFVFAKNNGGKVACDCFLNSYGHITVGVLAIIFFISTLVCEHFMVKNGKEWKFLHTVLAVLLFVTVYYITIAVGQFLFSTFS